MAEILHDIRTKIPTETLSVIQAIEMATGETMAEIVRCWIVSAAKAELHKAKIVARVLRSEGTAGDSSGNAGDTP